MSRYLVNIPT
jgi:hypothetical protein